MAEKNDGKGDDGMEVEVTKDLVRQCDDRTRSVAQHWRLLGELLKVETSHLNEIQRMYQESDQKKEMLRYWLKFKQGSVNSDKKLNDALAQIQNKFPDLQDRYYPNKMDDNIEKNLRQLRYEFVRISADASQWLMTKYPDIIIATQVLNDLLRSSLREPLPIDITTIENHKQLSQLLQANWSYTCPDLLNEIVQFSEIEDLQERMKKYMTRFEKLCESFVPVEDVQYEFEPQRPRWASLVLVLKSGTNLQIVEDFAKDAFNKYSRYMIICMVQVGSVRVIMQFPASIQHLIQERIDLYKDRKVKHENFISMRIEDPKIRSVATTTKIPKCIYSMHKPPNGTSKNY